MGLGSIALGSLLGRDSARANGVKPFLPGKPHFTPMGVKCGLPGRNGFTPLALALSRPSSEPSAIEPRPIEHWLKKWRRVLC